MININLSADTVDELRSKVMEALGMNKPMPMQEVVKAMAAKAPAPEPKKMVNEPKASEEPGKRVRRTKEQIEADRRAELKIPEPKEKVAPVIEDEEEVELEEIEAPAPQGKTLEDCQNVLREVLRTPGKGTAKAMELLAKYNVGKLTLLDSAKYDDFYALASQELA